MNRRPKPDRPAKRDIGNEVHALHEVVEEGFDKLACATEHIAEAVRGLTVPTPSTGGRFDLHVTEVVYPPKESLMPTTDHTPPLDLASSSVRAKLAVINPRLPDGSRVTSVTWTTDDETELPLEASPDDTVKDENGAEVLDEADGLPLSIFSTYANTPLTPDEGTKADGTVTCSASGMASIDKLVRYGDAPLGHFTMVATEAPEV